jgi:hypothetical protein
MLTKIQTLDDVKAFAKYLTVHEKLVLHPDEDFNNYVSLETQLPIYSKEDAELRNDLMNQCFQVCEQNNEDVYDSMSEVYLIETGLNKYIPLPSQPYAV